MNDSDRDFVLLKELDRPVAPRPEFADALRARLLRELVATNGARTPRAARPSPWALLVRHRRPALAGAIAIAAAAAAIVAAVLVSHPSPASAIDVIHQARQAFATTPPFKATLHVDLNPEGPNRVVPKGATATVQVSYGGPNRFRTEIVSEQPRVPGASAPGSYQVFDGRRLGTFDSSRNTFNSSPAARFEPLQFLSWRGAYPTWDRVCRGPDSRVLPDARIAGRDARHIRCVAFNGDSWELWIDRQTGLMLKVVGQVGGGGDYGALGGLPATSAKGGFEVKRLRYNPSFPTGTFKVAAPPGALDYEGRLRSATAKVPPFRAVVHRHGYVDRVLWRNNRSWRIEVLAGADPGLSGGPGSFVVSTDGNAKSYNARENSYSTNASSDYNPIMELVPEAMSSYSAVQCPVVGRERLAGREAFHRHCPGYDVWIDSATGVLLRMDHLWVRPIDYRPAFPPGTFRFAPPHGSRNQRELESDPDYKTKLAPGKTAPDWRAEKLGGGTFRLTDLRGKPALLLLFPDWCPAGDPVCDVFGALKQIYEETKDEVAIVWVDLQGKARQATETVRHSDLPFQVVVDPDDDSPGPDPVTEAWHVQAFPFWILLDSRGRVIEARLKPQTTAQLEELLAKAK